jgi:HD-GYP domain-containing protein (c-di-GMP phosphodiesterase class II)
MPVAHKDVAIRELTVGQPLDCDILDTSGIVLLRKGLIVSQSLVDGWTKRGFARVLLRCEESTPINDHPEDSSPDAQSAKLLRPYDPQLIKELSANFTRAKQVIDEIIFQLAVKEVPEMSTLEAVFLKYLDVTSVDHGAVLSNAAAQKIPQGKRSNSSLATRSVQMCMLGTVTAFVMGLSRDECQDIALAGMLHDMALFEEPLAMLQNDYNTPEERREVLFRHALHSAELFSRCHGVSELVRVVITQVHEQMDGRGFPRGLPGHHLNVLSRILNIVDAYLTLIEPEHAQTAFVPSDAIAYMVNHTNNGSFDRDCMKAFLSALSIYAVGSKVELDDQRTATVLRSSGSDPLRPIVRVDDGSDTIIDLRHSELYVTKPVTEPAFPHRRRLPKAQMQAVLWKPIY